MKQTCVIIGGTGAFGRWLANFLVLNFGDSLDIFISGKDKQRVAEISKTLGVGYFESNEEAVQKSDIIIFSVPINITVETIKKLGPFIKKGAVVCDITSIKKAPFDALQKYVPKECLIIPTHPMFGPSLKSIAGQVVVLTPAGEIKTDKRYVYFKEVLTSLGINLIEASAEEHDKMMAVIQGLTHYSMFVIGKTMQEYHTNIHTSLKFVSPIYKLMMSSVARYIGQVPDLYADIQMNNDEILNVHDIFISSAQTFHEIVKTKNRLAFIEEIDKTRTFFGKDHCENGQKYTDKIIYLLSKQSKLFQKNIGKEIYLENIYSNTKIFGVLNSYSESIIEVNNSIFNLNEWIIVTD